MKLSIRNKLFVGMIGLITFFVGASWFLNSHFLGKYYLSQKKHLLINSKRIINADYTGNPEDIALELEGLERNKGINVIVLDEAYDVKYASFTRNQRDSHRRPPPLERFPAADPVLIKLGSLPRGEHFMEVMADPRLDTSFLLLASRLENGEFLILSSPLAAIEESTAIANKFSLFTGFLTVLIGGVAVFFYANRFIRPILVLNDIAQRMTQLDFRKKYDLDTDDELSELGASINSLSDQLDTAIHDLRSANSKLKEDIEKERSLDRMRKEFVSNVSHELKTPIALIQGYAEGLKLNVNEDEADRDFYCDVIMDEANKMGTLVKDLLDLSQIESGYFKLDREDFDLASMIDVVLAKFRPLLAEKAIVVEIDKPAEITVNGDAVRLEQVLVNYLNNAINHVDEQKRIEITVTATEHVRVSVFNTGKQVPEAELERLWTSFYKVDKARTRAYGGTGLGLSIVRAIQESHGNGYGAENRSKGMLFWFEVDRPW